AANPRARLLSHNHGRAGARSCDGRRARPDPPGRIRKPEALRPRRGARPHRETLRPRRTLCLPWSTSIAVSADGLRLAAVSDEIGLAFGPMVYLPAFRAAQLMLFQGECVELHPAEVVAGVDRLLRLGTVDHDARHRPSRTPDRSLA